MSDSDLSDDSLTNALSGGRLYSFTLRDGSTHTERVTDEVPVADGWRF